MLGNFKIYNNENLIYWINNDNHISTDEATEISNELKSIISNNSFNRILVDNRNLNGVWNTDIDKIWIDLMTFIPTKIPKTVTICDNIINKLQLNYLAKKSNNSDQIKAFTTTEEDKILNFLELKNLDLLK